MAFDAGSIESRLDLDINPFIEGLRDAKARADEFSKNAVEAKLKLNSGEFKSELDAMKAKLDEFKNNAASATAKVNVARVEFDRLLLTLRAFARTVYTTKVRVDTVTSEAELEALRIRLAALHDRDVNVRVNTSD